MTVIDTVFIRLSAPEMRDYILAGVGRNSPAAGSNQTSHGEVVEDVKLVEVGGRV